MSSSNRKNLTLMKRINAFFIGSLICLFAGLNSANAQVEYQKGDVLLNFGIGSSYYYAGGLPVVASAEFALNDAISIGPYIAYTSWGYKTFGYSWNYTFIDIGGRGSYHFSKHLNLNTDKLDLYGGAMLGFVISSYNDNNSTTYVDAYGNTIKGGIFGGARWYFTPKFSANAEVGIAGISPAMIGITFKL